MRIAHGTILLQVQNIAVIKYKRESFLFYFGGIIPNGSRQHFKFKIRIWEGHGKF